MATRVIAVAATLTPNLRVVLQKSRSHGPTDATVFVARKAQKKGGRAREAITIPLKRVGFCCGDRGEQP